MSETSRPRADRAVPDGLARRGARLLVLLSALGAGSASVLWVEVGLTAAALDYALTIAVLYAVAVRVVRHGRLHADHPEADKAPARSGSLPSTVGSPPARR
ncbi:MAG: hypothetical protein KGL52_05245 [Rhodospirillales bacterium]|nr:hypothetical protein [Rhodospirillales bacterium]